MRDRMRLVVVCLVMLSLAVPPALSAAAGPTSAETLDGTGARDGSVIEESGDETQNWRNARELSDGDVYMGHVDRVDDRSDHFTVTAARHQEVNVHVYILGHDGLDEWVRPPTTDPPAPPAPPRASAMLDCFIYHDPQVGYPLDGAYNYFYVRHYMLNIVAPMPGTHTYHVNVSLNWAWTPNNHTWDYRLELEVGTVPEIAAGQAVTDTLDMAGRDTRWYRVRAGMGQELNGSFEVLNFDGGDPESRNVDVWVFPDDLGGYPRALSWDWSAAPNEPVEPFSVLSTYDGHFFIKLRGMNHQATLPCTYTLRTAVQDVPSFPDGGVQGAYFDRHWHDTDWYRFDMTADAGHPVKPGRWNEVRYFNMTERADAEDLPDFDLYLFGLAPGSRQLDLLDSSFRNDHADFQDPERDPNRNTEHVSAAAFYTGTYYLEVNAFNNTGYYDLRAEDLSPVASDGNDLPEKAEEIGRGVYEGYIHQALDHYDWYTVHTRTELRVQFDSFKTMDMFNLSIYKHDEATGEYRLLASDWNVNFNLSSRIDEVTHLIEVDLDLQGMGLGEGTYHIAVFAAVATGIANDPVSGRPYVYIHDGEAEAHYELRVWVDGNLDPEYDITPIPPETVEEDTDLLDRVDLDEHFICSDPEVEFRYKARIISGMGRIILEGSSLGFQAAEDFVGTVVIRVTAVTPRYQQFFQDWTIDFTAVNDAPRTTVSETPLVFTMPEDSTRNLDLGPLVYDVDEGDVLTASFDGPEHLSVDMEEGTFGLTLLGEQDWFGEQTVEFTFRDEEGASLVLPVRFVVENVDDPPSLVRDIDTVEMLEDTTVTIDLLDHILDPDGDVLDVSVSEDPYVGHRWDAEAGTLTLAPVEGWHGGRLLWVTATDPTGRSLQVSFWLRVQPVPDAPEIVSASPEALDVTLPEGRDLTFVVLEVTDQDNSVLFYRWTLDGVFAGPSTAFTYKPGIHDQGAHEVAVRVEDEEGQWVGRTWTVEVLDVPHSPDGGIATPPDGSRFREDEPVPFVAFFYDPDGDDLSYAWYIDGEAVSDQAVFEQKLDPGDHRVTLQVTSDGDSVTEELDVTVVEAGAGASALTVAAMVAGIAVVAGALILMLRRRGR